MVQITGGITLSGVTFSPGAGGAGGGAGGAGSTGDFGGTYSFGTAYGVSVDSSETYQSAALVQKFWKLSSTSFITTSGALTDFSSYPYDMGWYASLNTVSGTTISTTSVTKLFDQTIRSSQAHADVIQCSDSNYVAVYWYSGGAGSDSYKAWARPFTVNTSTGATSVASSWTQIGSFKSGWSATGADFAPIDSTSFGIWIAWMNYPTYQRDVTKVSVDWSTLAVTNGSTYTVSEAGQIPGDNDRSKKTSALMDNSQVLSIYHNRGGNGLGVHVVDYANSTPTGGSVQHYRWSLYSGPAENTLKLGNAVKVNSNQVVVFAGEYDGTASGTGNIVAQVANVSGTTVNSLTGSVTSMSEAGDGPGTSSTGISRNPYAVALDNNKVLVIIHNDTDVSGVSSGHTAFVATVNADNSVTFGSTQDTSTHSGFPSATILDEDTAVVAAQGNSTSGPMAYILTST